MLKVHLGKWSCPNVWTICQAPVGPLDSKISCIQVIFLRVHACCGMTCSCHFDKRASCFLPDALVLPYSVPPIFQKFLADTNHWQFLRWTWVGALLCLNCAPWWATHFSGGILEVGLVQKSLSLFSCLRFSLWHGLKRSKLKLGFDESTGSS